MNAGFVIAMLFAPLAARGWTALRMRTIRKRDAERAAHMDRMVGRWWLRRLTGLDSTGSCGSRSKGRGWKEARKAVEDWRGRRRGGQAS